MIESDGSRDRPIGTATTSAQELMQLAVEALHRAGFTVGDLRLIRLHSNGVFRVPSHRIIVRVGVGADVEGRARRAVVVTRWLETLGFPSVMPVAGVTQPIMLDDKAGFRHAVTFWREVYLDAEPVTPADLGALLRRLHGLAEPPEELPIFRPLDRLVEVTQSNSWLDSSDRGWLASRAAELQDALDTSIFTLGPTGLVHGDAQLANVLRVVDVGPVLADWDGVASAPREWDLVPMAVEQRFGGSPQMLRELLDAYGTDPSGSAGWTTLRDIYELRSVAAHIRRAPLSPSHAIEASRRIDSLRRGDPMIRWFPVG